MVANVTVCDIRVWAAAHGVDIVGTVSNPLRHTELQGLPILRQFIGPIWLGAGRVRRATPQMLEVLRQASRGLHELLAYRACIMSKRSGSSWRGRTMRRLLRRPYDG
jgi:hypothetical protein